MKALIISSLLFFSLRAMSEVGPGFTDCKNGIQSSRKAEPKIVNSPAATSSEVSAKAAGK